MPLRVGRIQNDTLTVTVSTNSAAGVGWCPLGIFNPDSAMHWVPPRDTAIQQDGPAWWYGVGEPVSAPPFTYPEMNKLRLRPTAPQPTTLQKGRIRFMANNSARGLFEVYVIDPDKEAIIHHAVLVADGEENAKLRALLAAKLSAEDLDRYDVVVTVLGGVRAKRRPQEVKIIKED